MNIETESYLAQRALWPASGRHILAHYDDESIVVYQAYRPSIGHFAAEHGHFGGEFSFERMSWIKPNFLWMMYRSGWGTKPGQELTLAVRITRAGFDEILAQAIHSSFVPEVYGTRDEWQSLGKRSQVRLQWDPDHNPSGGKEQRRAIQLGLRGKVLRQYAREWVVDIEDISGFVDEQRAHVRTKHQLMTPSERVYPVAEGPTRARLGIDDVPPAG